MENKSTQSKITPQEKLILESFNKLFISNRKQYILQNKDGSYTNSNVFTFNTNLYDNVLIRHIRKQSTIGVFSNEYYTPFIAFDIDMAEYEDKDRKQVVLNIIQCLGNLGIGRQYINVVFSGSKGWHLFIHFDNQILISYSKKLYAYVLQECNLNERICELRGLPNLGIKLPLSYNKKSGRLCYYVDVENGFSRIDDELYITTIRQFPQWLFCEYVDDVSRHRDKYIEIAEKELNKTNNKVLKEEISQAIEIEQNGLKFKGTRYNYIFKIAMLYNTRGLLIKEAKYKLYEWMDKQSTNFYSTDLTKCYKEIDNAIDWVYSKDIKFGADCSNVLFSKEELDFILTMPTFSCMKMLFVLMIYNKAYSHLSIDNSFYLTYGHIQSSCNLNDRHTINKNFKFLSDCNYLIKTKQGDALIANRYILNINIESNNQFVLYIKDILYSDLLINTVNNLYPESELQLLLSNSLLKTFNSTTLKSTT